LRNTNAIRELLWTAEEFRCELHGSSDLGHEEL
jgi:hypothetical protein